MVQGGKCFESHGPKGIKKGPPKRSFFLPRQQLYFVDVGGLGAFLALANFKAHSLVFIEGFEARALNGSVMNEEIGSAFVRGNETKTLVGVEPLDSSLRHKLFLCTTW